MCPGTSSARREGNAAHRHPQVARLHLSAVPGRYRTQGSHSERWTKGIPARPWSQVPSSFRPGVTNDSGSLLDAMRDFGEGLAARPAGGVLRSQDLMSATWATGYAQTSDHEPARGTTPTRSAAQVRARADRAPASTGPRASMRACSNHASPGACQANVLCIRLWMVSMNMLVGHCSAVDGRGCGKVDNRRKSPLTKVTGLRPSTGGAKYPQAGCAVCSS